MNIKELKELLQDRNGSLSIILPSGKFIPDHFHVTEVGRIDKNFIDCGGTVRSESHAVLQIWTADDVNHRLSPEKLRNILWLSGSVLKDDDLEVEVEYGEDAAARYRLADASVRPNAILLYLSSKKTDCLAPDRCGVNQCKGGKCC